MDSYRMKQLGRTLATYFIVGFLSITGYRIHKAGGTKHNFRYFKPAVASVMGSWMIVGKPIKKWARKGRTYRRGRKGISRRGKKSKRRRSRRRRSRRR